VVEVVVSVTHGSEEGDAIASRDLLQGKLGAVGV